MELLPIAEPLGRQPGRADAVRRRRTARAFRISRPGRARKSDPGRRPECGGAGRRSHRPTVRRLGEVRKSSRMAAEAPDREPTAALVLRFATLNTPKAG